MLATAVAPTPVNFGRQDPLSLSVGSRWQICQFRCDRRGAITACRRWPQFRASVLGSNEPTSSLR